MLVRFAVQANTLANMEFEFVFLRFDVEIVEFWMFFSSLER